MMEIISPTLEGLQEELVANCKEVICVVFMLECLIQYRKEAFAVSGEYTEEDRGLALCRVVDYIEQHVKDIDTVSNSIKKHLCARE